eukprot:TRINITY_DN62930_c0_g1_i1.p1 TRINITY_DN62930_c0_g1~~TRINITY_DN62930_c0_g1_i1.p1  ORF type:complete len:605 (-),score=34.67 TRINITY_DN62930_c0_g1_i1:2035-3849(-)
MNDQFLVPTQFPPAPGRHEVGAGRISGPPSVHSLPSQPPPHHPSTHQHVQPSSPPSAVRPFRPHHNPPPGGSLSSSQSDSDDYSDGGPPLPHPHHQQHYSQPPHPYHEDGPYYSSPQHHHHGRPRPSSPHHHHHGHDASHGSSWAAVPVDKTQNGEGDLGRFRVYLVNPISGKPVVHDFWAGYSNPVYPLRVDGQTKHGHGGSSPHRRHGSPSGKGSRSGRHGPGNTSPYARRLTGDEVFMCSLTVESARDVMLAAGLNYLFVEIRVGAAIRTTPATPVGNPEWHDDFEFELRNPQRTEIVIGLLASADQHGENPYLLGIGRLQASEFVPIGLMSRHIDRWVPAYSCDERGEPLHDSLGGVVLVTVDCNLAPSATLSPRKSGRHGSPTSSLSPSHHGATYLPTPSRPVTRMTTRYGADRYTVSVTVVGATGIEGTTIQRESCVEIKVGSLAYCTHTQVGLNPRFDQTFTFHVRSRDFIVEVGLHDPHSSHLSGTATVAAEEFLPIGLPTAHVEKVVPAITSQGTDAGRIHLSFDATSVNDGSPPPSPSGSRKHHSSHSPSHHHTQPHHSTTSRSTRRRRRKRMEPGVSYEYPTNWTPTGGTIRN